jgi:hypothetical protein
MIALHPADRAGLAWAQQQVAQHHYLRTRVDTRCSPFAYLVGVHGQYAGCLIFGRPESTRCYDGKLTYGSLEDVASGRAEFSRWEILNLARVWLDPRLQAGGDWYDAALLPGYVDRRGVWRSTLASYVIQESIREVSLDYLLARPPCFLDEPYQIRRVISYNDTRRHKGTIYRAAGFTRVRTNADGIETWTIEAPPLDDLEDRLVRAAAERSPRSRAYRAARQAESFRQEELSL